MPLPAPIPGLVIRYGYLWHDDYLAGHEEGKDRPAAIIATLRPADDPGETRVVVLPITHSPPAPSTIAVEIPARVKERLRLDDAHSWVVLSEWNEFTWPGPDVRRAPGGDESSIAYGMLPPAFFATIRDRFLALIAERKARRVHRTE